MSGVITSLSGWLEDGGKILKYRKNHDGYWMGELFVKQVTVTVIPSLKSLGSDRIIYS